MKELYRSKDNNYALIHNEDADFFTVRTPKGVFYIPIEVRDEMKKDNGLVQALTEHVLH